MKQFWDKNIFRRTISLKIWTYIAVPMFCIFILVHIIIQLFYNSVFRQRAIDNAQEETAYVASVFDDTWQDFLLRLVKKTASTEVGENLWDILDTAPSNQADINNQLQSLLNDYAEINNLIDSVLLAVRKQGEAPILFYPYSHRLTSGSALSLTAQTQAGFHILPARESPFSSHNQIIPVSAALSITHTDSYIWVLLSDSLPSSDLVLYFFLDNNAVNRYLSLYCSDESEGILFLTDASGTVISTPSSSDPDVSSAQLRDILQTAASAQTTYSSYMDQHIFMEKIGDSGLYLVNVVPESQFSQSWQNLSAILMLIAFFGISIITLVSLLISLLITSPLKKLMKSISAIENGTYVQKADIPVSDEIGQLNTSIDSMYHTIQEQIRIIHLREQEKYETHLQLLTEQMNPHFLYNALEFINMEVISCHVESASAMISSLGDYLHISLACGETELLLSQEIEHVLSYVNIMNYRFNHSIRVSINIPPELMRMKIVKCILQPLTENSLKHGFKIGTQNVFPISPMIDIGASMDESCLRLSITDNGAGIDIDKTRRIMYGTGDPAEKGHFGLHNIYARLCAAYGSVQAEFSSIPFYSNQITFLIPAAPFLEKQTAMKGSDIYDKERTPGGI